MQAFVLIHLYRAFIDNYLNHSWCGRWFVLCSCCDVSYHCLHRFFPFLLFVLQASLGSQLSRLLWHVHLEQQNKHKPLHNHKEKWYTFNILTPYYITVTNYQYDDNKTSFGQNLNYMTNENIISSTNYCNLG